VSFVPIGEFALGRMRCLSALSEWQQLNRVSEQAMARRLTHTQIVSHIYCKSVSWSVRWEAGRSRFNFYRFAQQVWPYLSFDQQREVAPLLAAAQWHCQQWESMRRIVHLIEPKSYDGSFFRAVLSVHSDKHGEAQKWIDVARIALHPQFAALGVTT
jgi:hypothetical protein